MADLDIGLPDISKQIAQGKEYLEIAKLTSAALRDEAKAMKELVAINPLKGAKDFQDMAKALRESTKAVADYNNIQEKSRKTQKEITVATAAETKAKIEQQEQTKKLNVLLKEEIALEDKQIGTLKRLAIESNKLRRERDGLNLETAEGVTRLKEINTQLDINNKKLMAASDANKRAKLNVGNYTDSINKARVGMLNLASAFGVATGIYAFTAALRGVFNIISENEDAFASLSAITGLTGQKFEVFKTAINQTAKELKVSSTEVASAAEKIASAQPKLLESADALSDVTKQAIILNKAIKGDLTETSMALVGVMNQYSLGAEEAARVINVLAAGSKAGAATVNQINESMVKFGTTAKLLNISVEESVGAIETLGEKAIFGADAGTALRNILLKMSAIDILPPKALAQLAKYGVDTAIVKDETLSFEERLRELSKVAGDSAAIMRIFGTENATAATVLLNNLDTYKSMTAAVTGTNTAQEQAAINSDTLSGVLKELGAAWDNLVLEWSEGTDVAGGLKDTLRFIAENLEDIIGWVFAGVKAWVLYRSTLTLFNNAGTGAIQMLRNLAKGAEGAKFSLGTLAKGLGGVVGIAAVLVPLLIDAGKAIYEMVNRTTALEKVTEKFNGRMDEEHSKMELLRVKIFQTNAGSKERQVLIDEINATYGTTLQNISDETEFMNQLSVAYKKVNDEMEKRIYQQLIEEELTDLFRQKRELERDRADGISFDLGNIFSEATGDPLQNVIDDIKELQAELFNLNRQVGTTGKLPGLRLGPRKIAESLGIDEDGKKSLKKDVEDVEKIIEPLIEGEDWIQYYDPTTGDLKVKDEDMKILPEETDMEILPEDIITKATAAEVKEIYDSITESVNGLSDAIDELIQLQTDAIETEIANKKDRVGMHEDRLQQFREQAAAGSLTAEQSIKAEEARIGNLQADIQALERKKQKLLVINLALQTATNLAEGGDGSAIAKATEQISGMIGKLQSFKSGTDQTGSGNVDKDGGFHAILHPDEMVMQKSLADPLRKAGLDRFDVATYAMAHHDDMVNGAAMLKSPFADVMSLATLNGIRDEVSEMKEEIKSLPKKMPQNKLDYDPIKRAVIETIKTDNEIQRFITHLKK